MKLISSIIKRPLITEKVSNQNEQLGQNVHSFEVNLGANKIEIRSAIETLFGVTVLGVRTIIVRGKARRFGRRTGRRSNWKKAYVTLSQNSVLNVVNPGAPA